MYDLLGVQEMQSTQDTVCDDGGGAFVVAASVLVHDGRGVAGVGVGVSICDDVVERPARVRGELGREVGVKVSLMVDIGER